VFLNTRVYPKVAGLAAWSEDCKWYSSLPLSAVVSHEFCVHNHLCCFSTTVYCCYCLFHYDSVRKLLVPPSYKSKMTLTSLLLSLLSPLKCRMQCLLIRPVPNANNFGKSVWTICGQDRRREVETGRKLCSLLCVSSDTTSALLYPIVRDFILKLRTFLAHQEVPLILRNRKFHYRVHKNPPLDLSWATWIQSTTSQPPSSTSTSILSSNLCLGLRSAILMEIKVRIAEWCSAGLRTGWSGVRVSTEVGNFSLHYRVQTGSGTLPASYPMDARFSFPGDKAAGAWSWLLNSI
jgi:hypothetical protein